VLELATMGFDHEFKHTQKCSLSPDPKQMPSDMGCFLATALKDSQSLFNWLRLQVFLTPHPRADCAQDAERQAEGVVNFLWWVAVAEHHSLDRLEATHTGIGI